MRDPNDKKTRPLFGDGATIRQLDKLVSAGTPGTTRAEILTKLIRGELRVPRPAPPPRHY